MDRGRAAEAVAAFARAVELDPTNAQYWTNFGNARRAAGDAAGADRRTGAPLEIRCADAADAANGVGVLLVQAGRAPGGRRVVRARGGGSPRLLRGAAEPWHRVPAGRRPGARRPHLPRGAAGARGIRARARGREETPGRVEVGRGG